MALIGKKTIEDSIKDGLMINVTTPGIFFALKAANVKPPKASLDAMDIMKLAGGICGGVLGKDYVVYKKWIKEWYNKILWLLMAITLHNARCRSILRASQLMFMLLYFSMVKIPLGMVTLR